MYSEPSHPPAPAPATHTGTEPQEGLEFWIALAVMVALFVAALLFVDLTAFGR